MREVENNSGIQIRHLRQGEEFFDSSEMVDGSLESEDTTQQIMNQFQDTPFFYDDGEQGILFEESTCEEEEDGDAPSERKRPSVAHGERHQEGSDE